MDAVQLHEVHERLRSAEDQTLRNQLGLASHEKECAIRYGHINESVAGIHDKFNRVAGVGAMTAVAIIGFLVKLVFFS